MAIKHPKNSALGSSNIQAFPKTQYEKIVEIIDALNDLTDSLGRGKFKERISL